MTRVPPTLRIEREAWRAGAGLLAAMDEVGRGALAGPVSVGVVLLAADSKPAPYGVADSKLLTPQARERLVPRIRRWALDSAVGHASPAEIDRIGIIAGLRLAAERAVSQLSIAPDWVLLDGNHDYLTHRDDPVLFDLGCHDGESPAVEPGRWRCEVPVRTVIKGDLRCSSIAAASVLAKTERDAMLVELAKTYPQYGFEENKAYSAPHHLAALAEHGPSEVHRRSWNLPGIGAAPGGAGGYHGFGRPDGEPVGPDRDSGGGPEDGDSNLYGLQGALAQPLAAAIGDDERMLLAEGAAS